MQDKVLFSVIVPVYNREELIRATVDSVLRQSFRSYELILVDDGSTDNTLTILKEYESETVRVFSKKNEERSVARNFGASVARGKYVTFLDSDDLLYEYHLDTALTLLEQHPDAAWFNLNHENLDAATNRKTASSVPNRSFIKKLWQGNFLACQGVFVRRDIFNAYRFNPQLNLMEDWELWLRLSSEYGYLYSEVNPTSVLVMHPGRSVASVEFGARLENKVELFIQSVNRSLSNRKDYQRYDRLLRSSCYSYVSLHLLLAGIKKNSFSYFLKSIAVNPGSLFSRRTAAILKRLIIVKG